MKRTTLQPIAFILFGILLLPIECYKILGFVNVVGRSHFNFNNAIFKSLANAGHQVTVVTPFPQISSEGNYSIIDISKEIVTYTSNWDVQKSSNLGIYQVTQIMGEHSRTFCDKMMKLDDIKKMFQSDEKLFDLIIFQIFIYYDCFLPLAEKWNIPAIATVTHRSLSAVDKITSNPRFPSVFPAEIGTFWNLRTLNGRLMNTWAHLFTDLSLSYVNFLNGREFYETHSEVLRPYAGYRNRKPTLVFYNNHFSLFPRALSPNAIEIGGIHLFSDAVKPLSPFFQKFVEEAKHGVIIFTLGSVLNASSIRLETRSAFKEAFRQIPQKVIWKYEEPMTDVPENVLIQKWIPQRDLLAHPNVKAAISHCGLSGTYELVYIGKPVIATPLFSDQKANSEALKHLGGAIILNLRSVTKEVLLDALNKIVNDTRYLENMQKISKRFKNRPMTPQQSAVYWTEYVIENDGAKHLQIPAAELYWFQYLLIDVLLYAITLTTLFLYSIYWIIRKIKTLCCVYNINRDQNKKQL